jgi:hypothetical protein
VGYLKDVGCESCHTAGRQHALNPTVVKLPSQTPESLCVTCHTPEQTDKRFVYAEYLKKVVHNPVAAPVK